MQRTQISLTTEERALLDKEAAHTGRSISALIRRAVSETYGSSRDLESDVRALELASGAWAERAVDGMAYVDDLRSGSRLDRVDGSHAR
jgi:uncharacterized protein (DUF1778 family)